RDELAQLLHARGAVAGAEQRLGQAFLRGEVSRVLFEGLLELGLRGFEVPVVKRLVAPLREELRGRAVGGGVPSDDREQAAEGDRRETGARGRDARHGPSLRPTRRTRKSNLPACANVPT